MKREDFEQALRALLAGTTGGALTVRAGDLHRAVGGYPGRDHRMSVRWYFAIKSAKFRRNRGPE